MEMTDLTHSPKIRTSMKLYPLAVISDCEKVIHFVIIIVTDCDIGIHLITIRLLINKLNSVYLIAHIESTFH